MTKKMTDNQLSEAEVRHLARLARLSLDHAEIELFKQQLSAVIGYNVSLLSELDVAEVPPTAQTTGLTNVWRSDDPQPSLPVEAALSQAPRAEAQQFLVPAVLDEN
jgi:aspartyl/glutamyl-tRNA(Asn/Gln) amidotransferase C subunit